MMDTRHCVRDDLPTSPSVGKRVFQAALNLFNKTVETTVRAAITISQSISGFDIEGLEENMQVAATDSDEPGDREQDVKKPVMILDKRGYNIATLLELGKNFTKPFHPSKFSSDAINGAYLSSLRVLRKPQRCTAS